MLVFICVLAGAFLLQNLLTFRQMQSFTRYYRLLRKDGSRAAIGRFAGKLHAGAVVIFAIDEDGTIRDGALMQGVTVFARFRPYDLFNGMRVGELTEADCSERRLSYSAAKAVTDAMYTYRKVMNGEEIPVPPSPLAAAAGKIGAAAKRVTGRGRLEDKAV